MKNNIISVTKGTYGQWIVTCEYAGWFHSRQYYTTKKEAISKAKNDKNFFASC